MQKNLTEIVFILDRSGSMTGLEGDGFASMIEKQRREAFVSTVFCIRSRKLDKPGRIE